MSLTVPSVSVIVPTINEVDNVEVLVQRLTESGMVFDEIIFVDDGSTDGTRESILALKSNTRVRLIERREAKLGLAGAVIAGAQAAHGNLLVLMDADLSHPPAMVPQLVEPLAAGRADMVIGSRYIRGGSTPGWPLWRKVMSRAAAAMSYPLAGVHDSMCGFFAIRRSVFLERASRAHGFKIAFEVLVHRGPKIRVLEIPITFRDRARGVSKMSFGIAVLFALGWAAALARLSPFRRVSTVTIAAAVPPVGGGVAIDA